MASSKALLLLAAVACLASVASARQWVVGGECGWKARFNHTGWAHGKTFRVGDTLLFRYRKGIHNVVQVGQEHFATCRRCGGRHENHRVWRSGYDVVHLDRPGRMWFICSKRNYCRRGMKLAIDVVDCADPATPPPPPPPFWYDPDPGTAPPPPLWRYPDAPPPPLWRYPDAPPPPQLGLTPPPPRWLWAPPPPRWLWAPPPPPRSAAVRNPVGGAVAAVAAAAVVAAALAF